MSPVNLGQLASTWPLPTGVVRHRRGQAAVDITLNNTFSARALQDGSGSNMFIEVVPYRKGWWLIHAETIWRTPDNVWTYFHWGVKLQDGGGSALNDLDGRGEYRNHQPLHLAQVWQVSVLDCAYKLEANTVYRCAMWWPNSSLGYNLVYHTNGYYHHITGEYLEDHAL